MDGRICSRVGFPANALGELFIVLRAVLVLFVALQSQFSAERLSVSFSIAGDLGSASWITHFQNQASSCIASRAGGHDINHHRLEYRKTGRVELEVQRELGADAARVVSGGDGS